MKKLFYLLTMVTSLGINFPSNAQCTISDLKIGSYDINYATCEVTFDLSWTQEINSGNKFAYIHIWAQPQYHTPAPNWQGMYSNSTAYPESPDLANVLSTIVIDDNHSNNPLIGSVYHPDTNYILPPQPGLSIVKIHLNNTLIERITIQNIKLTLPSCSGLQTLLFDIWASQATNGKNVHCAKQGFYLFMNQLKVNGLMTCTAPPTLQVFIQNVGPALPNVKFNIYLDYPPLSILNPADTLVYSSNLIGLSANNTYVSPLIGYLPGNVNNYSSTRPLLLEILVPERADFLTAVQNSCGPLPVTFTSFTAMQAKDKIVINWQTANEQNNKGFEIQRKLPGGNFQPIGFVPSGALNGNSDLLVNYQYNDLDNLTGVGQVFYRIKQIDLDGKSNYSQVREFKILLAKMNFIVYPNPSKGTTSITIPAGTGSVDIVINTIAGREVKRWNGVIANQLQVNNLAAGMYVLSFFVKETGKLVVSKLVIQ